MKQAQIMVPKDSLSPSSEAQSSIIFKAHYSPRSHIIVFFSSSEIQADDTRLPTTRETTMDFSEVSQKSSDYPHLNERDCFS